jgi:hypothetical protein
MNRNIFRKIFDKNKYQTLDKAESIKENIFNIYTTGIANFGLLESDQNLVVSWKLDCRNNIINNIPKQYSINIYHYDPLLVSMTRNEEQTNESKKKIKKYINKHLLPADLKHKRVKYSNFFCQRFTPDVIEGPYIIFDMAHLFKFKENKMNTVSYTSVYNENSQELLNLNVLRVGFVANMEISKHLLENKLFNVEEDGSVNTYVDMLIFMNKKFDNMEPAISIREFVQKVIRIIESKVCELRSEDTNKLDLYKIDNIMKRIKNKKLIIAEIMREIWDTSINEEIFDSIANIIIERNIINILQIELIE